MVSCTRSSASMGSLVWERAVFMSMLRSFWKFFWLSIILTVASTVGAKARLALGCRLLAYLVFSCRCARRALSPRGLGSRWLKSKLMASRKATSLGWTSQMVARIATPLSSCARDTISGQRYEVFDNCKRDMVYQIFVPLCRQARGSAAHTIPTPARGCFLFLGGKNVRIHILIRA
jgi:hypothetical protein